VHGEMEYIIITKEHSRAKVVPNFKVSRQTILMFTFCLPSILKCSCQPLFVCFLLKKISTQLVRPISQTQILLLTDIQWK